jgi:hypothetical protein
MGRATGTDLDRRECSERRRRARRTQSSIRQGRSPSRRVREPEPGRRSRPEPTALARRSDPNAAVPRTSREPSRVRNSRGAGRRRLARRGLGPGNSCPKRCDLWESSDSSEAAFRCTWTTTMGVATAGAGRPARASAHGGAFRNRLGTRPTSYEECAGRRLPAEVVLALNALKRPEPLPLNSAYTELSERGSSRP